MNRMFFIRPALFLVSSLAPMLLAAGEVNFRYYRFNPEELRNDATANSIQLAEFEMQYQGARVAGAAATNPGGNNPASQTPDKAVDGDTSTKWLDFFKGDLILDFGSNVTADAYAFTTAGDAIERDPVSWQILGSTNGTDWETIDVRVDYSTPTSRQTEVGPFALEASSYAFVRETLARIASVQTQIPGESDTVLFFNGHEVDDQGRVVFSAGFDRSGDGIGDASAVLVWEEGQLDLIEKTGPFTVEDQFLTTSIRNIRVSDTGLVLYDEEIEDTLDPVDEYDVRANRRLMLFDPLKKSSTELVRESDPVPGYSGYTLQNGNLNFNSYGEPLAVKSLLNEAGEVAFMARGENSTNDLISFLFVVSEDAGLEVRAATGENSPINGTTYDFFENHENDPGGLGDLSRNGTIVFDAGIDGTNITTDSDRAAFVQSSDGVTSLLKQENSASTLDDAIRQIIDLYIAEDGSRFMLALDSASGSFEIWTDAVSGGAMEPVIESGSNAGRIPADLGYGSAAVFESLSNIRFDPSGQLTFFAEVEEDTIFFPSSLGEAVFRWNDGELTKVMDENTVINGLVSGTSIETAFGIDTLRINSNGTVLVGADVSGSGEQALVAFPAGSDPDVLLESGTYTKGYEPDGAGLRVVSSFTEVSRLSDQGRVAVEVFLRPDGRALYAAEVGALSRPAVNLAFARPPDADELTLNIDALPNSMVTLESSEDLEFWSAVENLQVNPDGYVEWTFPISPERTKQFYRVVD